MAQHDYVIDNASGATVRADINSVLAAIKSSNSGTSAPGTPVAGMLWLDTDTPSATEWTLNIYDGSDWIAIGTVNATTNLFVPSSTATGALLIRAASASAARDAIGANVEPGAVSWFARNTAPTGWLKANGAAISRSTYATLFSAIGTTFGAGDGSTTFNIPDLRGEFVRGWDDSRGIDSGRLFGSAQADEIKSHQHGIQGSGTALPGSGYHGGMQFVGAVIPTDSFGGAETRPRNVALLACIKF